jgi:hypothetical protein
MPGPVLHVGAVLTCPHVGQVTAISANARVLVAAQPAVTVTDTFPIAGCPFNVSGKPQPCVRVQWLVPAARVKVMGQPVLTQLSTGLCLSPEQAPQGPPIVMVVQPRVLAT